MGYFVKFVPYNTNTLSALINKTIKFSTVYEFNDFNELGYLGFSNFSPNFKEIVIEKLQGNLCLARALCDKALKSGQYTLEVVANYKNLLEKNFQKSLENGKIVQLLEENLLFSRVGIFCVSSVAVFCDDSAQLMFAHYGGNLGGLALIYEISEEIIINNKVIYLSPTQRRDNDQAFTTDWYRDCLKGNYNKMECFRKKSEKWGYEHEYRLFKEPNIHLAEKCKATLKGIFYTTRFGQNEIDTLKKVNNEIYWDSLFVECIRPSYGSSEPHFKIESKDMKVCLWLEDQFY